MSNSNQNPSTQPETSQQETQAPAAAPTPTQDRKRQRSVVSYISIMFLAAFALLGMSLAMERRQHAENQQNLDNLNQSITGLKDSVSAMQSVQQLYEENAALKDQISNLEEQLEAIKTQQEGAVTQLTVDMERTSKAMDYFWQINEAYVRSRWSTARVLIKVMEDNSEGFALKDYLPKESTTNNGRFSPADRYQEIYDRVF